ncbi:MAG: repair protein SbcD/Mre11, partial [Acidimicrobiaceae bacterium]|nr:repair protein SbcD/Mre11 [Acidimicrobiaceae bacterium]
TAGGERAKLAVLPFLSQRYVIRADQLMNGDAADHDQAYAERMHRLIASLCDAFEPDTVNLVAAHLFADGGTMGGGERKAQTIMDYAVPASAFPGAAHYVALGHLHRAQKIAGACPIWYAGSPLQLDFGEVRDDKVVLVIEAEVGRPATIRQMLLHSGRRLRTVGGTLAELAGVDAEGDYLKVVVREPARAGLADEVRDLFPDAVDIVVDAPDAAGVDLSLGGTARLGRSPHDLFADYLHDRSIEDPRLERLFDQLLDDAHAT